MFRWTCLLVGVAAAAGLGWLLFGIGNDLKETLQLYRELGQLIHDQHYVIPIAAVPGLYAVNSKAVGSWPLAPGEPYIHGYEYAVPAR